MQLIDGPDPLAQFWTAHRTGEPIGLTTSGTTSASRIIVRTTASWVDYFDEVARRLSISSGDHIWIPGDLASTMNLWAAAIADWTGITWSHRLNERRPTLATMTPSVMARNLDKLPPTRLLIAGDGLTPKLKQTAVDAGHEVFHYYGAAELSLVAWGTCTTDLEPFTDVEIHIDDEHRIWVRSPGLSQGYADHVPGALRVREDGFATVGDQGELSERCLVIWGRPGSITTGGATIELAPLQAKLADQAGCRVELLGIEHDSLGQVLCAILDDPSAIDGLKAWSRHHLDAAQRPRKWVGIDAFPLTLAGKIDRAALKQLAMR